MKQRFKKTISLILCLALVLSTLTLGASAKSGKKAAAEPADKAASQRVVDHDCKTKWVYVQNKEGTGDLLTVDGFPIVEGMDMAFMFDTESVKQDVRKMILPLFKALLLGRKAEFTDLVCEILDKCFYSHYFNEDGTRVYDVQVDEYWYSLEECKKHPEKSYNYAKGYSKDRKGNTLPTTKYRTEFDFIMRQVDVSSCADVIGWDHLYYYAYSSFGARIRPATARWILFSSASAARSAAPISASSATRTTLTASSLRRRLWTGRTC